ncbi:hypothetical protein [Gymnodinialimonas sp.]
MIRRLLTAAAILFSGAATAQDIAIPVGQIGEGSVVTVRNSQGAVYTHLMLGINTPGLFVYETYNGAQPSGQLLFTDYTDHDGNLMRRVRPNVGTDTWTPHRCNRTMGRCTYTEVLANGTRSELIRTTTPIPGGFAFTITDTGGRTILSGDAVLMPQGWMQTGSYQFGNGTRVTSEAISVEFR